jgi:hypothetical protein
LADRDSKQAKTQQQAEDKRTSTIWEKTMEHVLFTQPNSPIYPRDLALLQHVFDQICHERGEDPSSVWASEIARTLLKLYRSGVRDKDLLLASIPRFRTRTAA